MWEEGGYFAPTIDKKKSPFTIILPPPNANAPLHMGHAMYTIEDVMIRYHRMKGDPTLWVPGADHAGIETQFVFEKFLAKQGKSRFDYDQETLYKMIWDFVHENRGTMEKQLRRLGFSLDWSNLVFTLDSHVVSTVYQTFKKLYDEGLAYRDVRLVNYCTKCGTGFSDLEVQSKETEGVLYFITYPLVELPDESITVATTRPETMFGDAAVMVHPKDKRFMNYHGMHVTIPLENRVIPIITDDHVDKAFGTGAVKVTPYHDFDDYEVGKRHTLMGKQIIGLDGKFINVPDQIIGLRVKAAREKTIELLGNNLTDQKPHTMAVKHCYRCGTVLEPLPIPQWYIKVKPLSQKAVQAIKEKKIMFVPKRFEKIAIRWLTDFHDWNISRQIVWGIRIPAWKCINCESSAVSSQLSDKKQEQWIITDGKKPDVCPACGSTNLIQETDTFDTWFSSGQWPFATLRAIDAKNNSEYFKIFYPTSVMETGYDILPMWVCRMLMLGIYATGIVPFQTVYLHGLVRDNKGQKMSKSKGNVTNPIEIVDTYGADALRMTLVFGTAAGNDQSLSEDKIRGMRNFANKVWNIGRFFIMNYQSSVISNRTIPFYDKSMDDLLSENDKQILKELNKLIQSVTKDMEQYRFSDAAQKLYDFVWHRIADQYLEENKERFKEGNMEALSVFRHVLLTILKLLHPFMPFVTEEIWEKMPKKFETPLMISPWPEAEEDR